MLCLKFKNIKANTSCCANASNQGKTPRKLPTNEAMVLVVSLSLFASCKKYFVLSLHLVFKDELLKNLR